MKDLKQFIKTTIREFLNENKINDFNEQEKSEIISFYRNYIFDKVRGTELYKKYNGGTIPHGFSQNSWDLLLNGIRDSGLDVNIVLNNKIKRLQEYIKKQIITDFNQNFNPSTGEFVGFINKEEKEQSIKKVKDEISLLKKFVINFK
jgi:hypothetical protein